MPMPWHSDWELCLSSNTSHGLVLSVYWSGQSHTSITAAQLAYLRVYNFFFFEQNVGICYSPTNP